MALNLQVTAPAVSAAELTPTMSGQAYAALRADILSGEIEPGAKLKMDDLQARYRLSSSPLREALNRLTAEQIVTVDDRRGFRAARISLADLQDITTFRLLLEINAFETSIEKGDAEWEAGIISALHRLEALESVLPAKTRSWDTSWIELHKSFHVALIGACGSNRILASCSAMFDQSQRYRSLSPKHRATPRNAGAEHRRLLEAALRRDKAGAKKLLTDHIQKTADEVAKYLARTDDQELDSAEPAWRRSRKLGDNHD